MYHKKCWKVHGIFLLLLSMLLLNACHMPAGSEQTEENIMELKLPCNIINGGKYNG